MRKYRIYIPFILLILSVLTLSQNVMSDDILLDINYSQLTRDTQKQIDCLAQNIYHEAGNEPQEGKIAVALVTLNRTTDAAERFPKNICGVVKQKTPSVCQFSWFCEANKIVRSQEMYNSAREVAIYVYVNYEKLKDTTKGALFYHADYVNPKWNLQKTTTIGRHIFYKDKGTRYDEQNESPTQGRTIKTFFLSTDGRSDPN